MKLISATTVALTALLRVTHANFDVYAEGIGGNGISGNTWGYQVYDSEPDCDNIIDWIWRQSGDVSGGKYGVRCKGSDDACAASGDPSGIEEMEFNFNSDDHHWSKLPNYYRYLFGTRLIFIYTIQLSTQIAAGVCLTRVINK